MRAGDANNDRQYELPSSPSLVILYNERLSSLFSLLTRLQFASYSLILEKTSFSYILFSLLYFRGNTLLSFIFCTTPLRPVYTNKQHRLLSTNIITCGRYSIAINSIYLSCLCKTCTNANEKARSIKIIIMVLSSAYALDVSICTKQS
jgi:hypothetical protein